MQSVKEIFHYLERTILIKEIDQGRSSFWAMVLGQISSNLKDSVIGSLKGGILRLIKQDRENDHSELFSDGSQRDLIAKLIHVLLALDLYKKEFEPDFLEDTA